MPRSCLAILLLIVISCRKAPGPAPSYDAGPSTVRAGPSDAGPQLTLSKLDAFIAYERLLRGEAALSPGEIRRLAQATDGGPERLEEAYARLRRRTERAQAVRLDAGLSPEDVEALESLTSEIALARAGLGGPDLAEALQALEAAKDRLPPEQRSGVERTVARLRAQQERATTLSEVRAQWGDAAVETALAREKASLELWGLDRH